MSDAYQAPLLTVAVLAFRKPVETRACLVSLKEHLKLERQEYEIVLLENGSEGQYAWDLYKEGLCDTVIVKRRSDGGGVGQTDLFRWSASEYTMFVQCDQLLMVDFTSAALAYLTTILSNGYDCCDLNGDQSNRGVWTDRAHLIKTAYFNSLAPHCHGGPGPYHAERWLENYLQEKVHPHKIVHVKPVFFADNGRTSIRSMPDGTLVYIETDTKKVSFAGKPSARHVFPELTDAEWDTALAGQWIDGTIPEAYKAHSFNHWDRA